MWKHWIICTRISWDLFDNILEGGTNTMGCENFSWGSKNVLTISLRRSENILKISLKVWKLLGNLLEGMKTFWQSVRGSEIWLIASLRVWRLFANLSKGVKTLANLSKGVKTLCQSLKGCEGSLPISQRVWRLFANLSKGMKTLCQSLSAGLRQFFNS